MYKKFLLIGSGGFINDVKPMLSSIAIEVRIANDASELPSRLKESVDAAIFDADSFPIDSPSGKTILDSLKNSKVKFITLSPKKSFNAVRRYARKNQFPVKAIDPDKIRKITKARIVVADVTHATELIRHDSEKLRQVVAELI